jgi:hypothetical protein
MLRSIEQILGYAELTLARRTLHYGWARAHIPAPETKASGCRIEIKERDT